jgi:hypothetical protein
VSAMIAYRAVRGLAGGLWRWSWQIRGSIAKVRTQAATPHTRTRKPQVQWRKWRRLVNTIAAPAASTASTTS